MLGVFRWVTRRVKDLAGMSAREATRRRIRTAQSSTHSLTHSWHSLVYASDVFMQRSQKTCFVATPFRGGPDPDHQNWRVFIQLAFFGVRRENNVVVVLWISPLPCPR